MSDTAWTIINLTAATAWIVWCICWTARRWSSLAKTIYHELFPFRLGFAVVQYVSAVVSSHHIVNPGAVFNLAISAACWWMSRGDKDDDDRWKKRRKRLTEKVASVGGRLQVVPTNG